jgi:ubiquinone/menaquinone biosynthesis C-methylase UbiE
LRIHDRGAKVTTDSADRYYGAVAADYDKQRVESPNWAAEQRFVEDALAHIEAGSRCLDVPVGTGRFFDLYKKYDVSTVGLDISSHMLGEAGKAAIRAGFSPELREGSILELPFEDREFDLVVCVRLMSWLEPHQMNIALRELARVTRRWAAVTVPMWLPVREAIRAFNIGVVPRRVKIAAGRVLWSVRRRPLHQRHNTRSTLAMIARHGFTVREKRHLALHADRRTVGFLLERV